MLLVRLLGQGGSERQTAVTAMALHRAGWECHVGCVEPGGIRASELREAGVPVVSFPIRTLVSAHTTGQGLALRRYLLDHAIDLVHSFDVPMNLFGVPYAWLARRPVVLSSQRAHRELTPGIHHKLLRVSDRLASGIVVNCDFIRRHLTEDEGVPAGKIRLCYNGIDTEQFHPRDRARPAEFGGASFVTGVVCGLRAEKGLDTLVSGFARARGARPGAKLVFVGGGVCLEPLQRQAAALGITEDVIFLPETAEVPRLLRGMDVFVLPSLSEALSNSLMEAMAAECCPIASRVGGNPELVEHGASGLLFEKGNDVDLADALGAVMRDDALRQRFASAARRRIEQNFSLDAAARTMMGIYEGFLNRRPAAPENS